ncbi:hypothetical protein GE253_23070 [Niveispirillum sp. SYP-B3756]|uniref:DUF6927 domain-containing protein n=1 Tax=Niveispirillum sp. SYP-B3756 TaxID=2662178 RepID=UPI0012911EE0|nr:hypothetical protein [Niveispirillum sp. SYP-B3756]MQP68204.1 hypothetical protein [Niveispirillum sp. SYP-B3756]
MEIQNDVAYAAVSEDAPVKRVYAAIVMLAPSDMDFGYLITSEAANPQTITCPQRILALLSDTENPDALTWRSRCREWAFNQQQVIKPGMRVRFATPVEFTDKSRHQLFEAVRPSQDLWRSVDASTLVRLEDIMRARTDWRLLHAGAVALKDWQDGRGPIPARQHVNGGGWVEASAWVDDGSFVASEATVKGASQIYGAARIEDQAQVTDSVVAGKAVIAGAAHVRQSTITGNAKIEGETAIERSLVTDHAVIKEDAWVVDSKVLDHASIGGKAKLDGCVVRGHAQVDGRATVTKGAFIGGDAHIGGNIEIAPGVQVTGASAFWRQEGSTWIGQQGERAVTLQKIGGKWQINPDTGPASVPIDFEYLAAARSVANKLLAGSNSFTTFVNGSEVTYSISESGWILTEVPPVQPTHTPDVEEEFDFDILSPQ